MPRNIQDNIEGIYMSVLYSICIPTYNRPHEIDRLLRTFSEILKFDGLREKVELCISDNNENTETKKIIDYYMKKKFLKIKYHRWGKNVGYDRNVLKALELASGKYLHAVSDEIYYTPESLAKIITILENNIDGIYISKKNKKIEDPSVLLNYMFSPSGIMNYFGTYMGSLIMKRKYYLDWVNEFSVYFDNYFGKAFMHLPLFIYFLKKAQKLSFLKMEIDTGKQAVLLPSKKSELYIKNYYFLIKACHDTKLINDEIFQRFKRNYLLALPFILFKIRIYMAPSLYKKELKPILSDINMVKNDFIYSYWHIFSLWRLLLFNNLVPYHFVYKFWYWYKKIIRKDPHSVDLFAEYNKWCN